MFVDENWTDNSFLFLLLAAVENSFENGGYSKAN
jgi:hypothetical protein